MLIVGERPNEDLAPGRRAAAAAGSGGELATVAESPVAMATAGDKPPVEVVGLIVGQAYFKFNKLIKLYGV
jgi:hypothetical protein